MPKRPLLALIAALGAALVGCGDGDAGGPASNGATPQSPQREIAEAAGAYHLGSSFEGLPLTAVLVPPEGPGGATSFVYGECEVPADPETGLSEGGCAPPLEVQTWSACDRPIRAADAAVPFRGALASWGAGGPGLFDHHEIFTARKTIAVFAGDPDLARRAAQRVRAAGGDAGDKLPPPAPAAAQGRLPCQRE